MDRTALADGIRRWAWDAASQVAAWETSTFMGDGWGKHAIRGMAGQIEESAGDIVDGAMNLLDAVTLNSPQMIEVARKQLAITLYGHDD